MASSLDAPKVFISYSWKPVMNKVKTIRLAERLVNEGVHVILDEWDLKEGQDKYHFMEQMVNNPDVKRVLLICNKDYTEKANKKSGGVGSESLIISNDIYSNTDQTKFIPIIFERDFESKEYVPTFIKSRIYIDLSNEDIFEDEYEKLMRNLFDKPASKRPPRGTPPAYITEEDSTFLRTSNKVKTIKNALLNNKKNVQVFIDDYYSIFIQALEDFEINNIEFETGLNIDDVVSTKIEELKFLRNDFVDFLDTVFTYSTQFDLDKFISFLEKLLEFLQNQESATFPNRTIGHYKGDQFKFFYYELFLYLTAVLIDKEKYKELGVILNTDFIISDKTSGNIGICSFCLFNQYVETLDDIRNKRLEMRRVSVTADLIKQRADIPKYSFDKLRDHDALLFFIKIMRDIDNPDQDNLFFSQRWFPRTTIYNYFKLPILEKLISKRHFEKMKPLFNVNSIEELKVKINKVTESKTDTFNISQYFNPSIAQIFNFKKLGTPN